MKKSEVLRYLGVPAGDETALDGMLERAKREIEQAAQPRHISRKFPLEVKGDSVKIGGAEIHSRSLANHMRGCGEAFLFALTLGAGVDTLIRRCSITDIPFVPVLQAYAAAYTEECADKAQEELERNAAEQGLYLRPRFSPGYGDFSLEAQKFFFSALDITKRIGVFLTDSCLMVPFKSITAIIGLSSDPSLCHIGKCMICTASDCPFRKEI